MDKKHIELIEELKLAAEAYYQGESALMTDEEYDSKLEFLEAEIEAGNLEINEDLEKLLNSVSAGTSSKISTVRHDYPMLSLGKAKNEEELKTYYTRLKNTGVKGFRLEVKLDGLALSAKYSGGKLAQLATRGDGVEGESLNHLINSKEVTILGLAKSVVSKEDFEVRGEIYISDSQFEVINATRKAVTGEEFSNSRNAISGLVKRAERGIGYSVEISFGAYSAYKEGNQVEFESLGVTELTTAKDLTKKELIAIDGKDYSEVKKVDFATLMDIVEKFGKARESFGIPTDGVVIKPINEIEMLNKLGFTSHHPVAYIAYKYPGAKGISEVLDIVISVGKTGRLTPKAIINPVEVSGVVIENVTCHNFSWLKEKGLRIGSKVYVTRANDVIPAIDSVIIVGDGPAIEAPTHCPKCSGELLGKGEVDKITGLHKTLLCTNELCPSRALFYIKSIVGRNFLDIDGLGDVALNALVEQEIINGIVDLYKVNAETLAKVVTGVTSTGSQRTLGAGNAKNIIESINNSKENTDSFKMLAALNIPGLGKSHSKKLIAKFDGIKEVLELEPSKLYEVDGIGDTVVNSFTKYKESAMKTFEELIALGFKVNDPSKDSIEVERKGSFSISGSVEGFSNREEFVAHMEGLGWEYHKSPKKDTDILFADPNGTSSKIKKARENGTRIMDNIKEL